ncbi:MAG: DUF2283 domain-containing protein, partial [Bacillota bacterium]
SREAVLGLPGACYRPKTTSHNAKSPLLISGSGCDGAWRLIVDYDASGLPVAVEILNASRVFGEKVLTVEVDLAPAAPDKR